VALAYAIAGLNKLTAEVSLSREPKCIQ
jgi:hypothetical protein